MVDIFSVPQKTEVNCSMNAKSFMVVGASKSGKSTLCAQAPKPIFLMTENGTEALTGFTPIPIASWADFKRAVNQLCTPKGREIFSTVVIDTYTNLILLLDKYIGSKMTNDEQQFDFGSDVSFGKGSKGMKNELGIQLQKLANQGYLLLNIVHAENKTDFKTQVNYIGTSLSPTLYGVAEKFVDQIIYLRKDINKSTGQEEHTIWFNSKGGFDGTGGRWTPKVDSVPCSYENLERVMLETIKESATSTGAKISETSAPAVTINADGYDFVTLKEEFQALTDKLLAASKDNALKIKSCVESVLGAGRKANDLEPAQAELLADIIASIKQTCGVVQKQEIKKESPKGEN